ncbi:hypothetical protein SNEBB_002812 [Seison nebaliae]|nr:hypothetical protein SNEBB_002812 [Seison nebaliae]
MSKKCRDPLIVKWERVEDLMEKLFTMVVSEREIKEWKVDVRKFYQFNYLCNHTQLGDLLKSFRSSLSKDEPSAEKKWEKFLEDLISKLRRLADQQHKSFGKIIEMDVEKLKELKFKEKTKDQLEKELNNNQMKLNEQETRKTILQKKNELLELAKINNNRLSNNLIELERQQLFVESHELKEENYINDKKDETRNMEKKIGETKTQIEEMNLENAAICKLRQEFVPSRLNVNERKEFPCLTIDEEIIHSEMQIIDGADKENEKYLDHLNNLRNSTKLEIHKSKEEIKQLLIVAELHQKRFKDKSDSLLKTIEYKSD